MHQQAYQAVVLLWQVCGLAVQWIMLELGCLLEGEYGASQACQMLVKMPPHHGVVVQLY